MVKIDKVCGSKLSEHSIYQMGCIISRDIARLVKVVDQLYDSQLLLDKRMTKLETQIGMIDDDINYIERKMRKHKTKKTHIKVIRPPNTDSESDMTHSESDEIHINLRDYEKSHTKPKSIIVTTNQAAAPPVTNTSMKKLHVISSPKK
jgi:hypothetical protein